MAELEAALDLLRCPACHAALRLEGEDVLACGDRACAARYPVVEGLPWLYRDVEGSRAQWAAKLQHYRTTVLAELEALDAELAREDVLETTRERLRRQRAGAERQAEQIFGLLAPFGFAESEAGGISADGDDMHAASMLQDRIPSAQHVTSYLATAFRDWAWHDEGDRGAPTHFEVLQAATLAERLIGGAGQAEADGEIRADGAVAEIAEGASALVLGGGAGRFAWELARRCPQARVVQLDLNPVLSRIADRVVKGESVELTELPRFPLSVEDSAVDQTLAAPTSGGPAWPPLMLVGDAFAPPFAAGTFDLLFTPWIVDIVPEAFPALARRFGALLAPQGRWIGFGPLSFESQRAADRLTPEEMVLVLEAVGFRVDQAGTEQVDYLHSPHDMARRGEEVFAWSATRTRAIEAPAPFAMHPEWLRDGRLPIPADPRFDAMRAEKTFDVEILKSIDGRASIEDLVVILSSRYGLAPDRCRNTILRFFVRWLETPPG